MKLLFNALISFFILFTNPFGILNISEELMETIGHRFHSIFLYNAPQDSDVIIVKIDDATIDKLSPTTGYPVDFRLHSKFLQTILCANPSSIYIDIEFQRVRPDIGQTDEEAMAGFKNALQTTVEDEYCRELNRKDGNNEQASADINSEIFLARTRASQDECKPFPDDTSTLINCPQFQLFETLRDTVTPVVISRSSPNQQFPIYPLITNITNTLRFSDSMSGQRALATGAETELSPAAQLIIARCRQKLADESLSEICQELLNAKKQTGFSEEIHENYNLVPLWQFYDDPTAISRQLQGTRTSNISGNQNLKSQDACNPFQTYPIDQTLTLGYRVKTLFFAFISGITNNIYTGEKVFGQSFCLTYPHISGYDLWNLTNFCRTDEGCADILNGLFKNKSVIYGYDLELSSDKILSPVLGLTSGLVLHAAATDNLIRQNTNYKREGQALSNPFHFDITINADTLPMVFLFALIMIEFASNFLIKNNKYFYRTSICILALGALITPYLFNFAPFDWLSALVIFSIMRRSNLLAPLDNFLTPYLSKLKKLTSS